MIFVEDFVFYWEECCEWVFLFIEFFGKVFIVGGICEICVFFYDVVIVFCFEWYFDVFDGGKIKVVYFGIVVD